MDKSPPEKLVIQGMNKPLSAILDSFVGNWDIKCANKAAYRTKWKEFLPREIYDTVSKTTETLYENWSMAYVPRISLRKVVACNAPSDTKDYSQLSTWPYFVMVLNGSRDNRPQTPLDAKDDLLQKNILDKGMIISELDNFYLCPNGFPYHYYASLLISKRKRPQGHVTPDDVTDWIKFSFLTDQYVFFNSLYAGASRPERFHAQVVDPEALRYEGKAVEYPIRKAKRKHLSDGVFEIQGYPLDALTFVGKDAPHHSSRMVERLEGVGLPYNVIVHGDEVTVVGRNAKREKSDCIGKKLGGYECSGIVLVGNVEEPLLGQIGHNKIIHGCDVFNELTYEVLWSNINASSLQSGWLRDLL